MNTQQIINELKTYASEDRRQTNQWFFKTGKGEYSEHDQFMGVRVPHTRQLAKRYFRQIDYEQLKALLQHPIHEVRHLGLIILLNKYQAGEQDQVFHYYLAHIDAVNNWDLVDTTTPHILGDYLWHHHQERKLLFTYVDSDDLWKRRIAIVATFAFIKQGEFTLTLEIAKRLLGDSQDLIHKALGWMLREIYKKQPSVCQDFLKQNYAQLPRTTLRYAIERMPESTRKRYLMGNF